MAYWTDQANILPLSPLPSIQHHPHGERQSAVDPVSGILAHVEYVAVEEGERAIEYADNVAVLRVAIDEIQAQEP